MLKLATTIALVLGLGLSAGCKKEEQTGGEPAAKQEPAKQEPAKQDPPKADPAATAPAPAPAEEGEYIKILASHANPKPDDPVTVSIKAWKVVKADFDPAKVEGGTAELALDLASLESGSAKRDGHLKSADYLDVGQFGTASIKIDNVKKTGDKSFGADATVNVHGVEKKLPVAFEVIASTADSITIKGGHKFSRHEFSIGKPSGEEDSVAGDLEIQMQLTLKKT